MTPEDLTEREILTILGFSHSEDIWYHDMFANKQKAERQNKQNTSLVAIWLKLQASANAAHPPNNYKPFPLLYKL